MLSCDSSGDRKGKRHIGLQHAIVATVREAKSPLCVNDSYVVGDRCRSLITVGRLVDTKKVEASQHSGAMCTIKE